ncbi:hypothetical protein [Flavobacterium terrisoli]|uniref:hypothetical protein n=1 Tax=Flavobacterium terrisoli TaxID=3242195 RepID=UPI0025436893|nr:hypothetical protein [Flavobacterium buctense]
MKHCFLLLALLSFGNFSFAQDTTNIKERDTTVNKDLEVDTYFRIQTFYPIHYGNTALAKAHQPRPAFSMQMQFLDFRNFKAGFGFDFVTYSITDKEMIANLSTSKYTSAYFLLSYEYKATNKIQITPNIGYGDARLDLGSRNSRFGKQNGNEFRIGAYVDYKVSKAIFVFGGVHYISNTFDIKTSPEYESFFSKANQIQINFGVRFGN